MSSSPRVNSDAALAAHFLEIDAMKLEIDTLTSSIDTDKARLKDIFRLIGSTGSLDEASASLLLAERDFLSKELEAQRSKEDRLLHTRNLLLERINLEKAEAAAAAAASGLFLVHL